jgi:hypothetical protein
MSGQILKILIRARYIRNPKANPKLRELFRRQIHGLWRSWLWDLYRRKLR